MQAEEEELLLKELDGFTDMSMQSDALEVCSRILRLKRISAGGIEAVVRVVGMFGTKKPWAPRIEVALARQSAKTRRDLREIMLCFYATFGDTKNALRFASTRRGLLPHELAFSIETFADAGRLREVRRLGLRIQRLVDRIDRGKKHPRLGTPLADELDYLLFGLGVFKAFCAHKDRDDDLEWFFAERHREDAITDWAAIAFDHPLGANAHYRAIELRLCIVLERIKHQIRCVEHARNRKEDDTVLSLPGNQDGLYAEMLERFIRYRRTLERLVPEKNRKELGMDRAPLNI